MKKFKKFVLPLGIFLSLVVLAGCSWFSSSEPTPPGPPAPDYPEDPAEYAFFYDFADVDLGELTELEGFVISNPNGERGDIEIVADSGTESGKALHLKTVTWAEAPRPNMNVRFPKWEIDSEVETIAFEYKLKHVSGSAGIYLYVNETGSDHRIILLPGNDGRLTWHASLDGFSATTVHALQPGWNTIRVVADRTTRSGDLYINDMESPVATSLPFQRVVETWEELQFIVVHETHVSEIREAYVGDFKVWAVDQQED